MNYQETLNFLFESTPMFQQIGKDAYKPGLYNSHALDEMLGFPHREFPTIHVGGTNGKGSCSHTIAAILQASGYNVGLYTSPHLIDFSERIRINGKPIEQDYVVNFVEEYRDRFLPLHPSFFELTTAMAFRYFADKKVDVAIIEVGLGGRLDCTNIIHPDLCVITNISPDHTQLLGDSIEKIASEKAGIIKANTPIVIGEYSNTTRKVFNDKAQEVSAPIVFATDSSIVIDSFLGEQWIYQTDRFGEIKGQLSGFCQEKNANTVLHAINQLKEQGRFQIPLEAIKKGFAEVCQLTGLNGRWQQLKASPKVICDTGHNIGGIEYIVRQLAGEKYNRLHIVIGMVDDKDINGVLSLLPTTATYYFTKASVKRALDEHKLKEIALQHQLLGDTYPTVEEAVNAAIQKSLPEDFIFVGGSTFIVADLLSSRDALNLN